MKHPSVRLFALFVVCLTTLAVAHAASDAAALTLPPPPPAAVLRHNLDGVAAETLTGLVLRFNDASLRDGGGVIRLEDARLLHDKRRLPQLALYNPLDAPALFDADPQPLSLYKVLGAVGAAVDRERFYPLMAAAAADAQGMLALPLALSAPLLYINRDAFAAAGLDAAQPPRDWRRLQQAAAALHKAGFDCPLTSSRFNWVHLQGIAARRGLPLLEKVGGEQRLTLNKLQVVKHLSLLSSWFKSRYFIYAGSGDYANEMFADGRCAMLTAASSLQMKLAQGPLAGRFVVAMTPRDDDAAAASEGMLPDGMSLWVMRPLAATEVRLVAAFIDFLLTPAVQREWVAATAFLPMTPQAANAIGGDAATAQALLLQMAFTTSPPQRVLQQRRRINSIVDEEIAQVWDYRKTPKQALDDAVQRVGAVALP